MGSAQEGRGSAPESGDRRLKRRRASPRPDAAELQRFVELLNGDLLVEPPSAEHLLRWEPDSLPKGPDDDE